MTLASYKVILMSILFSVALLFSCQESDDFSLPKHTLIVYMGGDNNLSGETSEKLEAITNGWEYKPDNKLLVYMDNRNGYPSLLEIVRENGRNVSRVVEEYPEENSANGDVLKRVIQSCISKYAANTYGLLFFSHGSGWLPKGTLGQPRSRSIIIDGGDEMELHDFANAIPSGVFDYIVFEACFMSGIEVAYELKDKAKYILSSSTEIVSPGFTPVYDKVINNLFDGKLNLFAEQYFDYINTRNDYRKSATLSLVKTSELSKLAVWIKENCNLQQLVDIDRIQHFDRYNEHLFFDFADYYSRLTDSGKRQELQQVLGNCVVWKNATDSFMPDDGGFTVNAFSGLTVYIPQEKFPFLNKEYRKLQWYKAITE